MAKKQPSEKSDQTPERPQTLLTEPVDVVDGVPDRSPRPRTWKWLVLFLIFLTWVAFLVMVKVVGSP